MKTTLHLVGSTDRGTTLVYSDVDAYHAGATHPKVTLYLDVTSPFGAAIPEGGTAPATITVTIEPEQS